MVVVMRIAGFLLSVFSGLVFAAPAPPLAQVKSVYVLPMANGLDQHLANRLTNEHVFRVVADAKEADAVLSDRLGPSFESTMEDLYPKPAPAPAPKKEKAKEKDAKDAKKTESDDAASEDTSTALKGDNGGHKFSSFGRGKGTLFLVDVSTRAVLWSTFEKPKDSTPEEQDRTAERVMLHLKQALKQK